jgi:hypothetical protein
MASRRAQRRRHRPSAWAPSASARQSDRAPASKAFPALEFRHVDGDDPTKVRACHYLSLQQVRRVWKFDRSVMDASASRFRLSPLPYRSLSRVSPVAVYRDKAGMSVDDHSRFQVYA